MPTGTMTERESHAVVCRRAAQALRILLPIAGHHRQVVRGIEAAIKSGNAMLLRTRMGILCDKLVDDAREDPQGDGSLPRPIKILIGSVLVDTDHYDEQNGKRIKTGPRPRIPWGDWNKTVSEAEEMVFTD